MRILIGTTLTSFAMRQEETWKPWTRHGEEHDRFAAIEASPFSSEEDLIPYLKMHDHLKDFRYYTLDDGREKVTTANRGLHIAMGRNVILDYAEINGYDYVLMMDADIEMEPDTIDKLLEVGSHVVGAYCSTFNQNGELASMFPMGEVRYHLATGCTLIEREVFTKIRYRPADDWGFMEDCERLGYLHKVRHDAPVKHYPEHIPPLEARGYDLSL